MSWHFSRALVAEYLGVSLTDGEPSVLWKSMPHAQDDSCSGKMKDTCHHSPYGIMYSPLTHESGEELLTSCLAGFPARTSVLPALARGSTENEAGCGEKWHESFVKWDPITSSWKTRQLSLLADLDEFSETWPAWGTMRAGECWEQTPPDFPITEPACGWLPTPSGVNGGRNNTMGRVDEWGGSSNPLRGTPIGKALSPNFEETVIGWPIDWTARTPLGTARFQQWLDSHGKL
jgi:hypothetical protein